MRRTARFFVLFSLLLGVFVSAGEARADGDCPGHQEQQGALCYDKCGGGYYGVGPVCWQHCPGGHRDDGAGCAIDAHTTGGNHSRCPWTDKECWFNWDKINCPPGYGGSAFGKCHRPFSRFWKHSYGRNSGDPLWSVRASTTLRNFLNWMVQQSSGLVGLFNNPVMRAFDPIPGWPQFRSALSDLASDGIGTFQHHASGCGNQIQGDRWGIPQWGELSGAINCYANAVRHGATAVEQNILNRLRQLMTSFVGAVKNGRGAVETIFNEFGGARIPFLGQLMAPLRSTITEAVDKVGGVFANHAAQCPGKLTGLNLNAALAVVSCFTGAIGEGLKELERLLLEKARGVMRELIGAVVNGPEAVDRILTSVEEKLALPGLRDALKPIRDMAKDVAQKGATEFGKLAAPCPDKLQKFSLGDLGGVLACLAGATKGALEAAERALTEKIRALLRKVVDASKQGGEAVEATFAELAKVGFVLPEELRKSVADVARAGGEEFAKLAEPCPGKFHKLIDVFPVSGCFLNAAAKGIGAALDSLLGPIKNCFPKLDLVAFFKGPTDLSAKGLLTSIAGTLDSGLGTVGCLAKLVFPKPIPGLPTVDQLIETLRMSGKKAVAFLGDPVGSFKRESEKMMKVVSGALPELMSWMSTFKTELRAVLTLDLKNPPLTPFEPTEQDERIKALVTTFLAPLGKLIDTLGDGFAPKEILDYAKGVIRAPAEGIALVIFRTFLIGRAQLMKIARIVVPALLKGVNFLTAELNKIKLPKALVSLAKRAFDTAHDLFGGVAAAVLEVLGLKDSAEQLVGSLVDAYDDVKGVSGRLGTLGATADATELISALNGGMSEETRKAKLTEATAELAAAEKAIAPARQATAAAEAIVQDAAEKATDEQKAAADEASAAEAKAQERVRAANERVEQLDPDKAMERTIGTVWESFSEAGMKVLWDTTANIGKVLSEAVVKLVSLVADVGIGVLSTVLSAIPFTTTYAPLITNITGFAFNILMNFVGVGRSLFFSLVLPEMRLLVGDQLTAMKSIFISMYRDPKERATLQRFGSSFTQLLDRLGPAADALRKMRETMKLGMNGLLVGPLGQLFKELPPPLFAALTKAVTTGVELLKKLASQALVQGASAVAGSAVKKEKLDVKEIATAILTEMKDPIVEWLVSQVPDGDPDAKLLSDGLREALGASADAALAKFKTNPASLLNPKAVLGIIAEGLGAETAVKAIARFLTRDLKMPVLEGAVVAAIKVLVPLMKDMSKVREIFSGGIFGVLRKIVAAMQPAIEALVLAKIPQKRQAAFKASVDKGFALVLEPGEFETMIKGGLSAIIAKIVEVCQTPVTEILLTDFPEGTLKEAIRGGVGVLGKRAASAGFVKSLNELGLVAIIGEVLAQPDVARAAAEFLTASFGEATLTESVEKSFAGFASELRTGKKKGALKGGLRAVLANFGPLVAKFVSTRLVGEPKVLQPLAPVFEAVMNDAIEVLKKPDMKTAALKGLGRRLMERVGAVLKKLGEKLLAQAGGKATAATTSLAEVARSLASKMNPGEKVRRVAAVLAELAKTETAALPVVTAAEVAK